MSEPKTGTLFWLPVLLDDRRLDATETLIMVALADHVNAQDECFVGVQMLAEASRCSYATAKRRLASLEERGFIRRQQRRRGDGNFSVCDFVLCREAIATPERSLSPHRGSSERAPTVAHLDEPAEVPHVEQPRNEPPLPPQRPGTVLTLVGLDSSPPARMETPPRQQVFDAWIASTGRTGRTNLDAKRRKFIDAALKDYPLEDVLDAVQGWRHSPHHRGENEQRTVYNDLCHVLRDSARIEQFRDLHRGTSVAAWRPRPASSDLLQRRMAQHQAAEAGA